MIIVITGASGGLGKELAKAYCEKGNKLILAGRNHEKLDSLKEELSDYDAEIFTYQLDISDPLAVEEFSGSTIQNFGNIDVLINNAGMGTFGKVTELDNDSISKVIDVNVKGTIYMTKFFIDNINDRLINIISTAGLKGKVNESVYVASKYAIRGFTESLMKEYEDKEINITAVYMGGMDTEFWSDTDHVKDSSGFLKPNYVAEMIKNSNIKDPELIIKRN